MSTTASLGVKINTKEIWETEEKESRTLSIALNSFLCPK